MRLEADKLVCKTGLSPRVLALLGLRPSKWGTWKLTRAQHVLAAAEFGFPTPPLAEREDPTQEGLRAYQKDAHAFLDERDGSGFLEHAPGLGKTRTTLEYLADRGRLDRTVIVCPKAVRYTWRAQAKLWLRRGFTVVEDPSDFVRKPGPWVLHWEMLAYSIERGRDKTGQRVYEWPFVDAIRQLAPDAIVFDESTRAKNPGAIRSQAAFLAAQASKTRICLSGYPAPHGPPDLWMQARLVHPDHPKPLGFRSSRGIEFECADLRPAYPGAPRGVTKVIGWKPDGLAELATRWAEIAHRRTKEEAAPDLPPKLFTRVDVELSKKERKAYDAMARDAVTYVQQVTEQGKSFREQLVAEHLLTQLIRLHQIAGGYAVGHEKSAKMEALFDLLEDLPRPVLVFCAYTQEPCSEIEAILRVARKKKLSVAPLYGDTSEREREKALDAFAAGKLDLLVAHPATGGVGLNLQAAKHCIWYSETYNWEHWAQGCDRVHRLGITEPPTIVSLIASGTIDERVAGARDRKTSIVGMLADAPLEVFS